VQKKEIARLYPMEKYTKASGAAIFLPKNLEKGVKIQ
jgi:hypothetical protein